MDIIEFDFFITSLKPSTHTLYQVREFTVEIKSIYSESVFIEPLIKMEVEL